MTTLPNRAHLASTYPVPTWSEHMAALGGLYDVLAEVVGIQTAQALTLLGGKITPTRGSVALETEGAAATDDLTTLGIDYIPEGRWLVLRANTAGRSITVKHQAGGTGQISLVGGADFLLNSLEKWLLLERQGSGWRELLRSYGADTAAMRASMGIGTPLEKTNNLSDLSSKAVARSNLGLAAVAASGAWSDLSGRPTLGIAAEQAPPNWALGEAAFLNINEIAAATLRSGQIIQRVEAVNRSYFGSTSTVPRDDSKPQSTEGSEILTATIIPTAASNRLVFYGCVQIRPPSGQFLALSLFTSASTDAVNTQCIGNSGGYTMSVPIRCEIMAGQTSPLTVSLRAGAEGGQWEINCGSGGGRGYGGALSCSLLIEEIKG